MASTELRAEPPRAPKTTPALERAQTAQAKHAAARGVLERRSMVRGLLLLAVVVLMASFWRAGLDRVFVPGWWRQW